MRSDGEYDIFIVGKGKHRMCLEILKAVPGIHQVCEWRMTGIPVPSFDL